MEEVADISGVGGRKDVLSHQEFRMMNQKPRRSWYLVFRALQEAPFIAAMTHLSDRPEMINPNQKDAEIC
ncbi:MAG: hypothetical protein FRX49_07557 [Trebouxia sp. A1-2]|nr:MAG: hypothetical protein FRX49_07557 [Trebouxia sp. A1-2]